jgi:hypothetical protein
MEQASASVKLHSAIFVFMTAPVLGDADDTERARLKLT